MSERQPEPPPSGPSSFPMGCLGSILLLPGLCSVFFAMNSLFNPDDFTRGMTQDPQVLTFMVVCFVISAGGVAILFRRSRRSGRS
jgi:hypothetical protein